jgi:ABC-type methionine transport system permease subunit
MPSLATNEASFDSSAETYIMAKLSTVVTSNILEFGVEDRSRTTSHCQLQIVPIPITTSLGSIRSSPFLILLLILTTTRDLLLLRRIQPSTATLAIRLGKAGSNTLRQHHHGIETSWRNLLVSKEL